MMVTIEFERNGQTGSRKIHDFALESTLANYRKAGYAIISPAPAAAVEAPAAAPAAPAAPAAALTGRVGKGLAVHAIIEGHSKCGASYRRNSLGATTRRVHLTGEAITCRHCH